LVGRQQLDATHHLALFQNNVRNDETQRPAVLGLERLAVGLPGDESIVVLERLERTLR